MSGSVPDLVETRAQLDADSIEDLKLRLSRRRPAADLGAGWERGVPSEWLSELLDDWQSFDFAAFQDRLDALPQYVATVDEQTIHLLRFEGKGRDPMPLVLTHGWPGSVLEHLKLVPLLTDPAAHGGDPGDAFTVIVPSLPGFGFSGRALNPGPFASQTADLWHAIMSKGFGYERYFAHGSDLGAGVTGWLARRHPDSVAAIHLATPSMATADEPRSEPEARYARAVAEWTAEEGGYAHEHTTKPATLGAALSDSPAGLAAWIGEKSINWSSDRADGTPAFERELLLSTLTLYWATNTIATSLLPYWSYRHAGGALPADDPSPVPTAITIFSGERVPFPKPPAELAERYYTVSGWAEHEVGGHFPAVSEPGLLAGALLSSFRAQR